MFVGANTRAIVPPVRKVRNGPQMCADASVVRLARLPTRLIVMNKKCVKLRFTSVCISFNSRIAILRNSSRLVSQRSQSVTSDIQRMLRRGKVIFELGTHIRSIGSSSIVCQSTIAKRRRRLRTSTVLLTANQHPGATNLGLTTTNMRIGRHNTVIISSCLRAAGPGVRTVNSMGNNLRFACVSLSSCHVLHRSLFKTKRHGISSHSPIDCSMFVSPPLSHVKLDRTRTHGGKLGVGIGGLPMTTVPHTEALNSAGKLFGIIISTSASGVIKYALFNPRSDRIVGLITVTVGAKRRCAFLHSFIFARPDVDRTLGSLVNFWELFERGVHRFTKETFTCLPGGSRCYTQVLWAPVIVAQVSTVNVTLLYVLYMASYNLGSERAAARSSSRANCSPIAASATTAVMPYCTGNCAIGCLPRRIHLISVRSPRGRDDDAFRCTLMPGNVGPINVPDSCAIVRAPIRRIVYVASLRLSGFVHLSTYGCIINVADAHRLFGGRVGSHLGSNRAIGVNVRKGFSGRIVVDVGPSIVFVSPFGQNKCSTVQRVNVPLIPRLKCGRVAPLKRTR